MGNSAQRNARARLMPLDLFEATPRRCVVMLENIRNIFQLMHTTHGRRLDIDHLKGCRTSHAKR